MLKSRICVASIMAIVALGACQPKAEAGSVMDGVGVNGVGAGAATGSASAPSMDAEANLKAAEDFLAKNKSVAGVQVTPSGLQYRITASGPIEGPKPSEQSMVQVNYEGKLLDGTVFDSSFARGEAAEFPVGQLIPAWVEALQLMRPGDEWTIFVHPNIGYGAAGAPGAIPPNALLIFRMRLEKVLSSGVTDLGIKAEAGATK